MPNLTPREIVHELNKHIVGQEPAKKSVALALRNRWRRMQLPAEMRAEVAPKNILMIGPTGVGKTEIARRILSADRRQAKARVDDVLARINPRYAKALRLRLLEDRPRAECAELLEVKLGTFDVLMLRAVRSFRKNWSEQP